MENYSHITPRGSIASTSSSLPSTPLPTISLSPPLAAAAAGYSVEYVDIQSNGTLYHNLGKCGAQNSPPAYSAGHVGNIYDSVA